ncbi:hypothetical protein ACFQO4_15945 [Saliphagus sp. GCM10025334]
MAREQVELDEETSAENNTKRPAEGTTKTLLNRRSYLAAAGAVTAGTAFAGTASAAEDYETITISPGERRVIRVGSGETFENVIFDQTAEGAAAVLVAHGTNWTVRNVGWKGPISGDNRAFTCSDQGGNTSVVENLYIGDGVVRDSVSSDQYAPALGIWVDPDHSGHIDFRNVYIEGALDNAFYCSAPGYTGAGGTVHIDNCYTKDNDISHYRISSTGDKVTNCVAVNTGSYRGRGVWAWGPGPAELENCHLDAGDGNYAIVAGSSNSGSCDVNCHNVQYSTEFNGGVRDGYGSIVSFDGDSGTNPQDFVPDGVPTSPEEAAGGTSSGENKNTGSASSELEPEPDSGSDSTEESNSESEIGPAGTRLRLEGTASYRIETDGSIEPYPEFVQYLDEGENYGDDWADWWLADSWTEWYVDGEITTFDLEDVDGNGPDVTVYYDGEEVDPDALAGDDTAGRDGSQGPEHTIRLVGECDYRIAVSGDIRPDDAIAQYVTEGEQYGDGEVDWYLTGSWTEWHYTGQIETLEVDSTDDLCVYVDGIRVNTNLL